MFYSLCIGRLSTDDDKMCLMSIFEWTGHSIQRIAGAVLFPHEFHFNPAATAPNSHHQITAILFDMKLLHKSDE